MKRIKKLDWIACSLVPLVECLCTRRFFTSSVCACVVCSFIAHWTIPLRGCGIHSYTALNVFPVENIYCFLLLLPFVCYFRSTAKLNGMAPLAKRTSFYVTHPLTLHQQMVFWCNSKWKISQRFAKQMNHQILLEIYGRNLPQFKDEINYCLLMSRSGMQTFKGPNWAGKRLWTSFKSQRIFFAVIGTIRCQQPYNGFEETIKKSWSTVHLTIFLRAHNASPCRLNA